MSTPSSAPAPAPSIALLGLEPVRAALEYASMRLMSKSALPAGDGHPVVIFPGLATDKTSIGPLTNFLQQLQYSAFDWGRGFNTGPQGDVDAWLDTLAQHVLELTAGHAKRISLIGWSLGGIYARELAKKLPRRVRQVITIGTPFAGSAEQTHAGWVYRLVHGQKPVLDEALLRRLRTTPAQPTTSIYSRSDGIVAWQACLNPADAPLGENIEVEGSHCGLGWNPKVLAIIADRLRQPEGAWRPFEAMPAQ
ncbi:MAG TPA: alpha/beta fold hydrolase [Albitalea sp.]|nr:alpha/beta fold hydrolase [Albitalea sp.]